MTAAFVSALHASLSPPAHENAPVPLPACLLLPWQRPGFIALLALQQRAFRQLHPQAGAHRRLCEAFCSYARWYFSWQETRPRASEARLAAHAFAAAFDRLYRPDASPGALARQLAAESMDGHSLTRLSCAFTLAYHHRYQLLGENAAFWDAPSRRLLEEGCRLLALRILQHCPALTFTPALPRRYLAALAPYRAVQQGLMRPPLSPRFPQRLRGSLTPPQQREISLGLLSAETALAGALEEALHATSLPAVHYQALRSLWLREETETPPAPPPEQREDARQAGQVILDYFRQLSDRLPSPPPAQALRHAPRRLDAAQLRFELEDARVHGLDALLEQLQQNTPLCFVSRVQALNFLKAAHYFHPQAVKRLPLTQISYLHGGHPQRLRKQDLTS